MAMLVNRRASISPSATTTAAASCSTSTAETASSSYFLPELIPLVASCLTSLQDFFALRAACRTYRALLPPSPSNLASQAPLLIVPHKASASEALFHAPVRRILRFRFPSTCLERRHPSLTRLHSLGCRVAVHHRNTSDRLRELHIYNILTGERARLPDPPKHIDGVIFSGDLIVTFMRYGLCILYYCRIGDAHWRAAWCAERHQLYSLMFVKGTLYALIGQNFRLAVVELHNNSIELLFLGDESSALSIKDFSQFWLAECRDELFLVVFVLYSRQRYHVFRWQSTERNCARTSSLGGCSLFFNRDLFAGWLGPDHTAVRKDCLYFSWLCGNWSEYSLVDGSWHEHVADYPGRPSTEDCIPLAWVLPSMG